MALITTCGEITKLTESGSVRTAVIRNMNPPPPKRAYGPDIPDARWAELLAIGEGNCACVSADSSSPTVPTNVTAC